MAAIVSSVDCSTISPSFGSIDRATVANGLPTFWRKLSIFRSNCSGVSPRR
jgi:hypothetical protein